MTCLVDQLILELLPAGDIARIEDEAADLGVAGGKGIGLIFKRGEVIRKVPEAQIVDALMEEVEKFAAEKTAEQADAAGV